jgi:hypothetical protein
MPSNKVVTYIDIDLNSIEEYWNGPLSLNVRAFQAQPSPTTLFNAATSVWHLHDWVWHDRNPGIDTRGSKEFEVYRNRLIEGCPELGWLRDIADASKHRGLGRKTKIQGAEPRKEGTPIGLLLALTREVLASISCSMTTRSMNAVLLAAVEFWRIELKDRDLPSP